MIGWNITKSMHPYSSLNRIIGVGLAQFFIAKNKMITNAEMM